MIVVDASVYVSALVEADVHHDKSQQWVEYQLAMGRVMVVPGIFLAEVAGSVSRRVGDPLWGRQVVRHIADSTSFDIRVVDRDLAIGSADLAATLALRGADAIYVALAHQLNLPLVTWDREQLQRGAQIIAVQTPEAVGDPFG